MEQEKKQETLSLIMTKGSLDSFYSCLVLASTALAMDKKVTVFFAGNSIKCLYKNLNSLSLSPIESEGMVMKLAFGSAWVRKIDWNNLLPRCFWILPGARKLATSAFKKNLKIKNQPSIEELREICIELGVSFVVCSMTLDLTGVDINSLIDNIEQAGAASYFAETMTSQALYI